MFKANRHGVREPNAKGLDARDPNASCFPSGPTRIFTIPRPFQIVQVPGLVLCLSEWNHSVRRIYTDRRGHPDGFPPSWMGHSIGEWDGDTLVVDTIVLRGETWIDSIGTPHSDALHIVYRLIGQEAPDR